MTFNIISHPLLILPMIPVVICIIISIYGNIELYKHNDCMFVKKRAVLFGLNITMILGIIFALCCYGFAVMQMNLALAISGVFFFASWFAIFLMLNVKNWMIYFKSQWTHYTLQVKWQKIINSNIAQELNEQNWFIKNNKTYGNLSYVHKLFGAVHFILFALSVYFMSNRILKSKHVHNVLTQLLFGVGLLFTLFIPVLLYGSIVCKTISANDLFSIHWESKMHAKISVVLIIGYFLTNVAKSILDRHITTLIIGVITVPYALFFMNYVSTFKIISRNKTETGCVAERELANCVQNASTASTEELKRITLSKVLSHSDALNLFMLHLSKEWSMECLFAWIEFTQFQKCLLSKIQSDVKPLDVQLIELPETIPISEVVAANDDDKVTIEGSMSLKARILYDKYILPGAEHQINIASKTRKQIYNILWSDKTMNLMDLLLVFENAKQEMEKLMGWSLIRFRKQPEFQQIVSMFAIFSKATNVNNVVKNAHQLINIMEMTPTMSGEIIGRDNDDQKHIPHLKNKPSLRNDMSASLLSIDAQQ